jgi:hypothetical protein
MPDADRQRNARLASNARADAKRVYDDDLDCYYDDWAYFEPLTDLDDYPDSDDMDDTYFGECDVRIVGEPRKQFLEPVWPPTDDVKEYLEALWSFEDARRQALEVKAATKNVLAKLDFDMFEKITRDHFAEIDAKVSAGAEEMRTMLRELEESRFVWVRSYEHCWYNPGNPQDECPRRYCPFGSGALSRPWTH